MQLCFCCNESGSQFIKGNEEGKSYTLHSYLYSYQNVERIRLIVARGWC